MSAEQDVLTGLRDLIAPDATANGAGPGTLFHLSDDPDVQWALGLTRGPTEPLGRWGQAVLTLLTRGPRSQPLTVHGFADPIVRRLITVAGATFGATTVNSVEHRGSSSGLDSSKRTIRADQLFIDLDYQA